VEIPCFFGSIIETIGSCIVRARPHR
jgi:hypothetical protein